MNIIHLQKIYQLNRWVIYMADLITAIGYKITRTKLARDCTSSSLVAGGVGFLVSDVIGVFPCGWGLKLFRQKRLNTAGEAVFVFDLLLPTDSVLQAVTRGFPVIPGFVIFAQINHREWVRLRLAQFVYEHGSLPRWAMAAA